MSTSNTHQRLANKVAVITGGNSGIGLAAAKEFRAQGASVVIVGRDENTLAQAARELGGDTLAVRADVAKLADIDKVIAATKEKFGRIDVLFANAGIAEFIPATQITEADFDKTMNINVKGLFFSVTKALPLMRKGGAIVLTSSVVTEKGFPGASVYAASKSAIRSLTRTFAAELLEQGIRVNSLSPGPIFTPILGRGVDKAQFEQMTQHLASTNPMKRMGTSEEMAKVALFLASDDSSYMTGADVMADGGLGQI
ncbi:MAG: SDR family oxidoreductase [Bdellovibrionales bacterium]|nr:SDR family oxidoreductase [Bdellovibrionales bacterium]